MKKTEMNYEKAFTALQTIMLEIESGEITIDELSEKIKEATNLLKFCKEKLKATEQDVSKLLEEMNDEV